MSSILVLRQAMWSSWVDMKMVYTPATWAGGWMVRVVCQVVFYTMLGTLLGDPERTEYLLVGAAVFIAVTETMMTSASTTWERMSGTMSLLAAAPGSMALVLIGRSWTWIASGTVSASIALLVLAPLFDVRISPDRAALTVALIFATALTVYPLGLCCGSLALRFHSLRNVFSNITTLFMTAFCGAMVPTSYWPEPLQLIAAAFPPEHTLTAIRLTLDNAPPAQVLPELAWAFATAAAWLIPAILSLRWFESNARKRGTIDFGD